MLNFHVKFTQCVANLWQSYIGFSAIAIVTFFESQPNLKDLDDKCQEFTEYTLNELQFLYMKAEGDNKKVFTNLTIIIIFQHLIWNSETFLVVHSSCRQWVLILPLLKVHKRSTV
jgi:hypothetical protein